MTIGLGRIGIGVVLGLTTGTTAVEGFGSLGGFGALGAFSCGTCALFLLPFGFVSTDNGVEVAVANVAGTKAIWPSAPVTIVYVLRGFIREEPVMMVEFCAGCSEVGIKAGCGITAH
jgi:hypothetical protein